MCGHTVPFSMPNKPRTKESSGAVNTNFDMGSFGKAALYGGVRRQAASGEGGGEQGQGCFSPHDSAHQLSDLEGCICPRMSQRLPPKGGSPTSLRHVGECSEIPLGKMSGGNPGSERLVLQPRGAFKAWTVCWCLNVRGKLRNQVGTARVSPLLLPSVSF